MTFAPGVSFYDDTPGTATQATATQDSLHALITSASILGVTAGEHSTESFVIFRKSGGAYPTGDEDQDNRSLWFDVDDAVLRQRAVPGGLGNQDGKYHDWFSEFHGSNEDNNYHIPKGSVLVSTGRFEFSPCITLMSYSVSGIAKTTLATEGTYGDVVKLGIHEVLVEGPVFPGDGLISSTTTGHAISQTAGPFGRAGIHGTVFGKALYSLGSVNQLVTCLVVM